MTAIFSAIALVLLGALADNASASSDYWQQHVSYHISATLIDSIHTLDGNVSVVYQNNSPDTLREVYFHLYSNAFQPGSMMDERARAIHTGGVGDRIAKLPESEWGKYWINSVAADGSNATFSINGTIMRVELPGPLAPGGTTTLAMPFREQIPRQIRRSGWRSYEGVEYSMSQWYPKIAEYDRDGWQIQEYVSREFYGVWGDFDVELTLPSSFTVGASGQCLNPKEAGHGYDRIAAGEKEGEWGPAPSAEGMTTWHFAASPVHDFAWVADRQYVHRWTTMNDTITLHSIFKEQVAELWQNSLKYSEDVLRIYGELYGPYAYRNFSTTMAGDGGMEYPELIMITGYRSGLSLPGVIAHEIAHQWFYGMLGSNETREAFMDEGFTTYATTQSMNRMFGADQQMPGAEHSWLDWFIPKFDNKRDNYRGYQSIASAHYEEPLSIPHDWFREDVNAGQVYGKTAAILSMLQYALGNDVFDAGMKNYFRDWHFKHPHLVDFQRVMENTANTKLDWFIDEWFRTTRTLDYEILNVSSRETDSGFRSTVRLKNNDLAVMPIDLLLHYDDGSSESAVIPLGLNRASGYIKPGVDRTLPAWDWTAPRYRASFTSKSKLAWAEIDTSWRLQDPNWMNNYSGSSGLWMPRGYWAVWKQLQMLPPIDGYYAIARPIVWWSELDKLNIGAGLKFGMNNSFSGDARLIYNADPKRFVGDSAVEVRWYDRIDGAISYATPVDWLGRLTTFNASMGKMYGVATARASLTKILRPEYYYLGPTHAFNAYIEKQERLNDRYPFYHSGWDPGMLHVGGITYDYTSEDRSLRVETGAETSVWDADNHFARAQAKFAYEFQLSRDIGVHFRAAAASATENTPVQRRFWLNRESNYEEQSNAFFRAVTGISSRLDHNASFFGEGGAGVRGYSAGNADSDLVGLQMFGASFEVGLPNPLANLGSVPRALSFGLFCDAGWVGNPGNDMFSTIRSELRTDVGLRINLSTLFWLPWQLRGVADEYASVPSLGFIVPLYENHPIDGKQPFALRWAVSLGASF